MPTLIDSLEVEGTLKVKRIRQDPLFITAAVQTTQLLFDSPRLTIILGTVAGQIVRLPDATTMNSGEDKRILNNSTQPLTVQDFAGTLLGYLSQNRTGNFVVTSTATAPGTWYAAFASFGANRQLTTTSVQATTTSSVAFTTYLTLTTTDPLPIGKYALRFQAAMGVAGNARSYQIEVRQAATVLRSIIRTPLDSNERPLDSGFEEIIVTTAGVMIFTINFRVSPITGGTTATAYSANLEIRRSDD